MPWRYRLLLGLLAVSLVSTIDLVPDFVPVLGQLDDVIVAAAVLRAVVGGAGPALVREHWPGSQESLGLVLRLAGVR